MQKSSLLFPDAPSLPEPAFLKLLNDPLLSTPLPRNFSAEKEAEHLKQLWARSPQMRTYRFLYFVHAGGSGMVFKVQRQGAANVEALKIARQHLFEPSHLPQHAARSLSPVSPQELSALERLAHPNVVQLHSTISLDGQIVGLGTTYIDEPRNLDEYVNHILEQAPKKGPHVYSTERLENACVFSSEVH